MSNATRQIMIVNHENRCLKFGAETASNRLRRIGVRLLEIINDKNNVWSDKHKLQMESLKDDLEDVECFLYSMK